MLPTVGLTPTSVRGARPSLTPSASSKPASPISPLLATETHSDSPSHYAAARSDEAELSGVMLSCAAADTNLTGCDAAATYGQADCSNLMLLCDLAVSSPSQNLLTSPEAASCISSTVGDPASTPTDSSGSQGRHPVCSTAGAKGNAVPHDRSRSKSGRSTAANRGMCATAVPAPAARMLTRGQAAAAAAATAHQAKAVPASSSAAASAGRKQARSLKPEAPTRRQPQRAAKPQWR